MPTPAASPDMKRPIALSRAAAGLALLMLPLAAPADDRLKLNVVLEGRLVTTPTSTSFLHAGLGKTRYGHIPRRVEASLAQAALLVRVEPRADLTLSAHANVDADHDFGRRADLVEAFARYAPALGDTVSLEVKAGLFFPNLSLENTDAAWLSPYTTTFSAINSWIGEEVRSLGIEAGPSILAGETRLNAWGALTTRNDPSGSLLAWRGFALHDRVSALGDRLPLPSLPAFAPSGLFPDQPTWVEPMREVDDRWSWSAGLSVRNPRYRVKALYQPATADPGRFDGRQYAWRTGYTALGAARVLGPVEILAQALDGETRMGVLAGGGNPIVAGFRAGYLLATWASSADRHRASVRFDAFRVTDRDPFPIVDANRDRGHAWTFAYRAQPARHHSVTVEILRVTSDRDNRRSLGLPTRATEISGTISWRLMF